MNKTARLKRLSRHLLATTCLTVAAAGAASAVTITENPEPGQFGTTFAAATPIDGLTGNDTVVGETEDNNFTAAWFIFTNLVPGESFSYSLSVQNSNSPYGNGTFDLEDSLGNNLITPFSIPSGNSTMTNVTSGTGTVGIDGQIVAGIVDSISNEAAHIFFQVQITAPQAPEPGTFAELGLGLAGAAVALKRRLKTRKA